MSRRPLPDLSAYLVLDPGLCGGPEGMIATTRAALAGGITVVQLRDKTGGTEALIDTGRALMRLLEGTDVALIVNDDIAAALAIGAHGLHIGQGDLPVAEARARLGATPLLGLSVESPELAAQVDPALVDYVGCGPVFATPTKTDHKTPVGFDGLARIVAAAPVPAVAIGGLKPEHAPDALRAGAQGLAVVSAICGQPDPQTATRALVTALSEARP
ncbi:thiamine phosphate synthase [Fluviibacterium sp. DFM31]|uniref:Thiamine-phosphate synthase n=1 Tax=Meridianimarinicoccus marinus TaxID=3231483 RepID=A0ABV3L3N4_9RHOB